MRGRLALVGTGAKIAPMCCQRVAHEHAQSVVILQRTQEVQDVLLLSLVEPVEVVDDRVRL